MPSKKRWSQRVTQTSDALTLEEGVFKREPRAIARSLQRSAERSKRRKSSPYRSAMSMLTFYENRAGRTLAASKKRKIEAAKEKLRKLYGKTPAKRKTVTNRKARGKQPTRRRTTRKRAKRA